jgi:hypothetical protein
MNLRHHFKNPDFVVRAGMAFLIPAMLWRWLATHTGLSVSTNWADATAGFLLGISIGLMLLGLAKGGRLRSSKQ